METTVGGGANIFYGMGGNGMSDLRRLGKRSLEWDLNDWRWDGDMFMATQFDSAPTDPRTRSRPFFPQGTGVLGTANSPNSASSRSGEANLGVEKGKRELEKRRRVRNDDPNDVAAGLSLMIGGHGYPSPERDVGDWEETSAKRIKSGCPNQTPNRAACQVDGCGADLSNGKDYHRRHKVCEMHSKASRALVGNIMQRFCQQCSRFHALQEFDEGKRSCRRRLAGHNKRRRKAHADTVSGSSLDDEQSSGYLLISILRILSNMQWNKPEQKDQDLLSHLLEGLASQAGEHGNMKISGLLRNSGLASTLLSNGIQGAPIANKQQYKIPASEISQRQVQSDDAIDRNIQIVPPTKVITEHAVKDGNPAYSEVRDSAVEKIKLNDFDLNDTYVDSDDFAEDIERSPATNLEGGSPECPVWMQHNSNNSSPPQTSGHSDSASAQSASSSSGDAQSRTDRMVFKLFGKGPEDIPFVLRAQILEWLSHSPTDIESYIKPGCIILTLYLRLAEYEWDELCSNLTSSLSRLLDVADNAFWRIGWLYIRVQQQIAFVYNGQVVLDMPLPLRSNNYSTILSIRPIAISISEEAQFLVRGLNVSWPATRLHCALEGTYLAQEATNELIEGGNILKDDDELQCLKFFCSIPFVTGRGFIEIEDHGLGSSFFPFIVAEKDVCSEICMLESAMDFNEATDDIQKRTGKIEAKNQAINFIHEMGWLLHRSHLRSRKGNHPDPNSNAFSLNRFKWLMEFSMEHDWCAVVKKLLDILLEGTVGSGERASLDLALAQMSLLHRAVRRNCRPLVELLLSYVPEKVTDESQADEKHGNSFLFRPDAVGPAGLTPLHIAAGRDGSEDVLDALTNDPRMVGIGAWKSACDATGFTPEAYARLRGHYSYIHLIQRKINKRAAPGQVVLDMPGVLKDSNTHCKTTHMPAPGFEIGKAELRPKGYCKLCGPRLAYGSTTRSLVYRPAMLSMVAIAAVCVCVALFFKSSPSVSHLRAQPFRWALLDYGPR